MFSSAVRQSMLNGAGSAIGWLSFHSAFPGAAGANELAITRAAAPWIAATDGQKRRAGQLSITVPAGSVIAWIGLWNAQTGGTFEGRAPVGGHPLEFYTLTGPNRIVIPGTHNWADGDTVVFFGGTPPPPLVEGQDYYLRDVLSDQVRVASSPGFTAIPLTGPAAAGCLISKRTVIAAVSGTSIIVVPQFFLRFVRNYDPVWSGSTSISLTPGGTPFDLRTVCTDANGDVMAFRLATLALDGIDSTPLPTGVSLSSSGFVSCLPNAPGISSLNGIVFVADDGVGD